MELINRELSWLSFNERVLQEALDPRVPLIERMHFLGIYSNNLDEFFRVRVANLRRMIAVKKRRIDGYEGSTSELYREIRKKVLKQQTKFELAYQKIKNELEQEGIYHLDEENCSAVHREEINRFYHDQVKHAIVPILLDKKNPFPKLVDSGIYLAVRMAMKKGKNRFALVQIPDVFPRFHRLSDKNGQYVILLDDIIRLNLASVFSIFEFEKIDAFTFKFTRDAELNLDDDLSVSIIEKIEKSIKQRKKGDPVRLVYDDRMPKDLLDHLLRSLGLRFGVNTIPGGKYHNFKDFMSFPDFGRTSLINTPQPPVAHPDLEGKPSYISEILHKDILLHFPYQRFDYVVDLLREAAIDPKVTAIRINIYRVARNSQIINALLAAVMNGKQVTVVVELQARFDEENNLHWAGVLQENGAKVIFGTQHMKIHSKLMQITRISGKKEQLITYVGTGNFNERTAMVYSDLALLTADQQISAEVKKLFRLLENKMDRGVFKQLLVSPFNSRQRLFTLIDNEIRAAKKGEPSSIRIKLNNLTDKRMIRKLYEANNQGVRIEMIIRGICCLVPGVEGLSENISVISIVDRYLEHARFFIFENGGQKKYILTSADWMERNLEKRIEVGCPVNDPDLQRELDIIFDYQWKGSVKSRMVRKDLKNIYRKSDPPFHAQKELYQHYLRLVNLPESDPDRA